MTKYTVKLGEVDLSKNPKPNILIDSSTYELVYEFIRVRPNEKLLHFYMNPIEDKEQNKMIYNVEIFTESK